MDILEIITRLKIELSVFTESKEYILSVSSKKITASIFIAIYLSELCIYDSDTILTISDRVWFENEYGVSRFFDNEKWINIPKLYSTLSSHVLSLPNWKMN